MQLAFACVHGHEITSGSAGLALYNLMIQLFLIRGWISAAGKDESVLPALARPGITTTVHQDIASVVCIKNLESDLCQGHCSIKYVHVVRTKSDKTGVNMFQNITRSTAVALISIGIPAMTILLAYPYLESLPLGRTTLNLVRMYVQCI